MALSNPPSQNLSDIVNRKNATPDDFYGDGQGATASALPLNIQNATTTQQDIFLPDSQPLTLDTPKPKAGFFGTVAHDLYEDSEIGAGVRGVSSILEHLNHMNDVVPDGWTSYNKEMYKDIDQRYWDYMRDATSPAEQEARRQHVLSLQDRDDFYDNGKWVAHLLGGIGSVAASPSTYFLPIASTLKYAKTGQNIIKNMMRVAPSLSTQSIVHEAFVEGTKADGNLEQFALNSMRDVTFGLALTGVAAGIGKGFTGGKLWNTRKVVNMMYEGIDTKLKVGKDGVVKGYEAVPIPGVVANAQQLTQAQLFVDSKMAESGLFGLAFVGGTVTKVAAALSPVVRGLTHDFASINDFTNRFSDHSVIVEGMIRKEGRQALPLNFEREMWGVNNSVRRMTSQLEGYRAEANGLESSANREIAEKSLDEAITRGQSYNKEDFGRAVGMTIITGESHDNKAINSAAKYVSDHLEKVYKKYLTAHGYDENILSPRNAVNYLMQSWDRDAILQRPEDFINFISEQLEIQDNTILEHMAPVNEAQDFLNQLLEHKLTDSSYDRSLVNEIEAARNNVKEAEANLLKQIDENPELHALLEERLILNKDEAKQLSDLLKPRSDLEAKIAKQREVVTLLKKTKSQSKTSAIKAVKTETKIKSTGKMSAAEKKLIAEQDTLSNLERDLKEINVELREKADRREINPSMFKRNPETGEIIFRDPNVKPKFRGVYESQYHRTLAAQSLRETIMNTNEEAISQRILNGITGSSAANSTKERTVLIPQKAIQMANFLNNDISMNVANYTVALGRKTAWRTAYGEEGTEGIIYRHAQENREKERVILEKLKGDKQKKALIKLNKNFESGMTFIKNAHNVAMGITGVSAEARAFTKGLRDLMVSTKLGAVILTQITDVGGIIFKHGFSSTILHGVLPALTTMNGLVKNGHGLAHIENAAHLNIALEQVGSAYSDRMWNSTTIKDPAVAGKLANGLEKLSHLSSNLSGTNIADNFLQRVAASTAQSKFIKMLYKHQAGTLSERETLQLLKYGINPANDAERMLAAYERTGAEGNGFGGHHSKYYDWDDIESKVKFGNAMMSAVRDSVIKKGLLDAPFWTSNPIWGSFVLFHGWSFSAFTRYTVPLMQRFDVDKAMGIGTMLLLGTLVDPMRRLMRGEQMQLDKEHLLTGSITNGGVFGIVAEMAQIANKFTDSEFLGESYSDKYQNRDKIGSLVGPFGSYLTDLAAAVTMAGSGKFNQQDVKKTARLVPLLNLSYLQYIDNLLTKNSGLPEKRSQATNWFGE